MYAYVCLLFMLIDVYAFYVFYMLFFILMLMHDYDLMY